MFSFTNYSLFFLTEIKYRIFYILFSTSLILVYSIVYLNLFLILLLKPLEYLNLDLNLHSLSIFLFDNLLYDFYESDNLNNKIFTYKNGSLNFFDYFPVFEININNNSLLYFYLILYILILFIIPIFIYHIYVFILPGLFLYELCSIKKKIFFFYIIFYFYIKYFNSFFIYIILCLTYNNFYEYYNYEFDIEFDFLYYIKVHVKLILLFYINFLTYFLYD